MKSTPDHPFAQDFKSIFIANYTFFQTATTYTNGTVQLCILIYFLVLGKMLTF
jgi:hypothetical protein